MTKRTAVATVAVLVVVGGALVWWQTRARDSAAPPNEPAAPAASRSAPDDSANPAPPVMPSERTVSEEDDPVGSLRLEGQVLGADDVPVGGATVRVDSRPSKTAVTEADGSFAFDSLIERTYHLTASVDDLAGGPVQHALSADSDPVVIRVRAGGVLEVEVVGDESRPVAGATVSTEGIVDREQTTDEAGIARLRGVPGGASQVRVVADGYADEALAGPGTVTL